MAGKKVCKTVTKVFNISSKLRCCDTVLIEGNYYGVASIIENDPLKLWHAIHKRGSSISLVRPTYNKLKLAVEVISPLEVSEVNKQHEQYKVKRRLMKEISRGMLNTSASKFKKLS